MMCTVTRQALAFMVILGAGGMTGFNAGAGAKGVLLAQGGETWEDFIRIRRGKTEPRVEAQEPQAAKTRASEKEKSPEGKKPATSDRARQLKALLADPSAAPGDAPASDVTLSEPVVYVRVPRTHGPQDVALSDGTTYTLESPDIWDALPDSRLVYSGFNAPGQLVLRQPDGTERLLYDCFKKPEPCVPLDPAVSFDGRKILFSVYRGKRLQSASWSKVTLPNQILAAATEAQLHVVDVSSGEVTPLAHRPGVFDVSPAWLPDGRIMFASTLSNTRQPWLNGIGDNTRPVSQLYIAGPDGTSAVNISPHEITTAMHPYVLQSGRIAYSSQWLSHNLAYGTTNSGINWPGTLDNMWLVMDMNLDGGDMTARLGAHRNSVSSAGGRNKTMKALHFLGERRNGDICVANYYRRNNFGLGDVFCWQPEPVGVEGALPHFLPRGIYSVANWSQSDDNPSVRQDGIYLGKIGYPEGMNDDQLLLTVGRGYCTNASGSVKSFQKAVADQPDKRACDVGLYHTTIIPSRSMADLVPVVDHEDWHEFSGRIVAPREVETPPLLATDDDSCQLVSVDAGMAETAPHRPYRFNANYRTAANNGSEIDGLDHAELAGIRFWEVVPNERRKRTFKNSTGNRLRMLGDVPLLDDSSFKVQLPCDMPFLMAGIDREGRTIKRDQVPQSLRPGEKRVCAGCHLHSHEGKPYEQSLAATADAVALMASRPAPNYKDDIKPIFERRCMSCHKDDNVPLLDYDKLVWDHFQRSVPEEKRLQVSNSENERRRFGLHRPYTSKYVNNMYARESLLYWKAANQRTDGRTDDTYSNDIDFGKDHPTDITRGELKVLVEWLDSGATYID